MIRNTTLAITALILGTLVACAPPRPAASAASGIEEDRSPIEAAAETESTSTSSADVPVGDLVCRSKSINGNTELYLRWSGDEATGILRTIGPSGAVTDTRVRAERNGSAIVVDESSSTDLATHLAMVATQGNKRRIRVVEMGQARSGECE